MSDWRIQECSACGQEFMTDVAGETICRRGCKLKRLWKCHDCGWEFSIDHEPHTQHSPECPTTPHDAVPFETCASLGCSFEDVCERCCTVCNKPVRFLETAGETPHPTT